MLELFSVRLLGLSFGVALVLSACGGSTETLPAVGESSGGSASIPGGGSAGSSTAAGGTSEGGGAAGTGDVPEAQCGPGKKKCYGQCVPADELAYGCGSSCEACEVLHGQADCQGDACIAASCDAPFGDCDGSLDNGCETNLQSDAKNCGACGYECPPGTFCNAGNCSDTCGSKTQCGSSCVDVSNDANNCGSCGHVCPGTTHGYAKCVGGSCRIACYSGYTQCGSSCLNISSDINNCGSCGHKCPTVSHGSPSCSSGGCSIACFNGYTQCGSSCVDMSSDAENCGACGHSCQGASCVSGQCQAVVVKAVEPKPSGIAVGGGKIYWLNTETNSVWQTSTSGVGEKKLATTGQMPQALVLYGGYLYWICGKNGEIQKAPTFGCASGGDTCVTTVYAGAGENVDNPKDIAIGGGYIFFSSLQKKQVLRISLAGGHVDTVSQELGGWLTITVQGSNVVWADWDNQVIKKRSVAGGNVSTVASLSVKPWGLEAVGGDLYFIHYTDKTAKTDEIMKISSGSTTAVMRANSLRKAGFLVSDGTTLYWTTVKEDDVTGSANRIMKMAL